MERAAAFANPNGNVTEHLPEPDPSTKPPRACRGLLTFEFQDDHSSMLRTPASPDASSGEPALGAPATPGTSGTSISSGTSVSSGTSISSGTSGTSGSSGTSGTSDTSATSISSATSDDSSKTDDSIQSDPLKVPAEVQIYVGKETPGTSRDMDWEGTVIAAKESSSDEETTETSKGQKRKKLDSGIGEGTTASSSSSPVKSESAVSEPDVITLSDLENDPNLVGGRYVHKRRRTHADSSSEGSASDSSAGRRRRKRRAHERRDALARRPRRAGPDARRVRLSVLMKRGVKELPLPYALKKYVNLGRCFEF